MYKLTAAANGVLHAGFVRHFEDVWQRSRPAQGPNGQREGTAAATVETDGRRRSLLTYKEPALDAASGSKPEHETEVASPDAVDVLLRGVGFEHLVSFEKHCTNYRFRAEGPGS
jgi:adenylate cyclase, class 2